MPLAGIQAPKEVARLDLGCVRNLWDNPILRCCCYAARATIIFTDPRAKRTVSGLPDLTNKDPSVFTKENFVILLTGNPNFVLWCVATLKLSPEKAVQKYLVRNRESLRNSWALGLFWRSRSSSFSTKRTFLNANWLLFMQSFAVTAVTSTSTDAKRPKSFWTGNWIGLRWFSFSERKSAFGLLVLIKPLRLTDFVWSVWRLVSNVRSSSRRLIDVLGSAVPLAAAAAAAAAAKQAKLSHLNSVTKTITFLVILLGFYLILLIIEDSFITCNDGWHSLRWHSHPSALNSYCSTLRVSLRE